MELHFSLSVHMVPLKSFEIKCISISCSACGPGICDIYKAYFVNYLASLHLFTKSILLSSQNKCSFRSWARELRWGKKSRVHMKREGVEKKEIEIELYWKARTTLILGQILNPKTTLILGRREY